MAPIRDSDYVQREADLRAAVKALYPAFKRYPFTPEITIKFSRLGPTPLQPSLRLSQVTGVDLEWAAASGLNTWGSLDEFKAVLPRMLEIVAETGAIARTSAAHLFQHFSDGNWTHWIKREQDALSKYMSALWLRVLSEFPCPLMSAEEALCALAGALGRLDPFLVAWERNFEPASAHHLAQFVLDCCDTLEKSKALPNDFWSRRKELANQVIIWLQRQSLLTRLEPLFSKFHEADDSACFARAFDALGSFQLKHAS